MEKENKMAIWNDAELHFLNCNSTVCPMDTLASPAIWKLLHPSTRSSQGPKDGHCAMTPHATARKYLRRVP